MTEYCNRADWNSAIDSGSSQCRTRLTNVQPSYTLRPAAIAVNVRPCDCKTVKTSVSDSTQVNHSPAGILRGEYTICESYRNHQAHASTHPIDMATASESTVPMNWPLAVAIVLLSEYPEYVRDDPSGVTMLTRRPPQDIAFIPDDCLYILAVFATALRLIRYNVTGLRSSTSHFIHNLLGLYRDWDLEGDARLTSGGVERARNVFERAFD